MYSFFFHWILRSQVDSTQAKSNYPLSVFCSMFCLLPAVLKVEFSISSCVFLWNSSPVYLSISEIPIHLSSRSRCEVMGWCYSCSVIWSWITHDPEEIVHWSIPSGDELPYAEMVRAPVWVVAVWVFEHISCWLQFPSVHTPHQDPSYRFIGFQNLCLTGSFWITRTGT